MERNPCRKKKKKRAYQLWIIRHFRHFLGKKNIDRKENKAECFKYSSVTNCVSNGSIITTHHLIKRK